MPRNATATLLKRSLFRYVAFIVPYTCSIVWGANDAKRDFDISTTNAAESLRRFSIQADREIIFPAATVSGINTNPIKGSFTPREAIDRMVANTGLIAVEDGKTAALMVYQPVGVGRSPNQVSSAVNTPPQLKEDPTPMNSSNKKSLFATALAMLSLAAEPMSGQSAPAATSQDSQDSVETVQLSPFVVASDQDTGWMASSTLVGNRTLEELRNVPMSIDALTSEFLADVGAYTLEDAGKWVANIDARTDPAERRGDEVAINYRGMANGGHQHGQSSRNFFIWYPPTDNYNVERIDFSKGSNSLMFGDSQPGGRATIYTKRPRFRNFNNLVMRVDNNESHRVQLDVNRKLTDKLAVRLNLLDRADRTYIEYAVSNLRAIHGAVEFQPFKTTSIRMELEQGKFTRTRTSNQIRVRDLSAPGRGFGSNAWYYTSDGEVIPRRGTGPQTVDSIAAGGSQLSLLEGMSQVVTFRDRVGNATVDSNQTLTVRGYDRLINMLGTNDFLDRPYQNFTTWFEQAVGDFRLELSYNQQRQQQSRNDSSFGPTISLDRAGRPYMDAGFSTKQFGNFVETGRVAVSYPFKFGNWMQQYVVLSADRQEDFMLGFRQGFANLAVLDTDPTANITQQNIMIRAYLDDPRFPSKAFWDALKPENMPTSSTFRPGFYETTDPNKPFGDKYYRRSQTASASGTYWNGRVLSMVGVRRDQIDRKRITDIPQTVNGADIYLGPPDKVPEAYEYDPEFDLDSTTYTTGLTYRLTRDINLYGTRSESFSAQGLADFTGRIMGAITGVTKEAGVKTSLFGGKMAISAGVYQVDRNNAQFRYEPNLLTETEMEELFNPNNVLPGAPDYFQVRTGLNQESRSVSSSERSKGYEMTLQMQRFKGFQARLTASHNEVTATRDMSQFRAFTEAAIARTQQALGAGGNPAMAEDQTLINDALEILAANEGVGTVMGTRNTPYFVNWALDYEFSRESWLKNTRAAVSGNWRSPYNMTLLNGTIYKSESEHPLSAYVIHRRQILGQQYSFRLGLNNLYDLSNNSDKVKSGVVRLDAAGQPVWNYRYKTPMSADLTVTVDFDIKRRTKAAAVAP